MRKVLVISYWYPPYLSAASIRVSKFTKYLPEFGWMPVVLTTSTRLPPILTLKSAGPIYRTDPIYPLLPLNRFSGSDTDGASSIRRRLFKIAAKSYRRIMIPDTQIGWYPAALAAGREIISRERPDIIFSSALPATIHLVANRLARETGIPWVAEFRDLWTDNSLFQRPESLLSVERVLERRVMRRAKGIVTVSEPLAAILEKRLSKPVAVITNGYDPEDYHDYVTPTQHFTLTYTGGYYSHNYDSVPLFEAIAQLAREKLITPQSFELRFIGTKVTELYRSIQRLGIDRFVRFVDVVPLEESVRAQMESTALLFFSWVGLRGEGVFSSKIFEYLGSGKPILAIGPDNVAMRLIESCQAGVVARSSTQVASTLRRWLQEFRLSGTVGIPRAAGGLKAFERRELTGDLAEILNQACQSG